ncbi:hypothetical protein VL01_01050 [Aeromonas enteropelogenes]|nr:hypothetical protein VL01_01050 [Aeromonas enteropelogenes]
MLETGDKAGTPLYGASEKSTLVFAHIHLSRQSQRWRGVRKGSNDAFLLQQNVRESDRHDSLHPIWVKQIWLYREAGCGVP